MNANFTSWGGQMLEAWQKMAEEWWERLLSDPERLSRLASRLGGEQSRASASAADLSKLVEALELLDRRLTKAEGDIQKLTGTLSNAIALLEKSTGSAAPEERKDQ